MRPRMPDVRDEMHRRRHRRHRPHQRQRMRAVPALPGDHERWLAPNARVLKRRARREGRPAMNRRRFLPLSAAALCALTGPGRNPDRMAGHRPWRRDLPAPCRRRPAPRPPQPSPVEAEIARIETLASLHRRLGPDPAEPRRPPRLALARPSRPLDPCRRRSTPRPTGAFDPTVQPLWLALATGGDAHAARRPIGWDRVHLSRPRKSVSTPVRR